jgi:hypothetical protein
LLIQLIYKLLEQLRRLQHVIYPELRDAYPVISDPVIRPVIRPYLLIYVAVADLVPLELALLGSLLLLKHRIHPLLQFLQRPRLVRMLIPLVLASGNSPCRHMSGSHC